MNTWLGLRYSLRVLTLGLGTLFAVPQVAFPQDKTPAQTMDELLQLVKQDGMKELEVNRQREAIFVQDKAKQSQLLAAAKAELAQLEQQSESLRSTYEVQEKSLAEMEEKLTLTMGTLGELYGVVRQVAADALGQFQGSLISHQIPGRGPFLQSLAETKSLPSTVELEKLWYYLQQEMTESGKVVVYPGQVVGADGTAKERKVLRVGPFNAFTDDLFLNYNPETGNLVELARQPSSHHVSAASDLAEAKEGYHPFPVDPSRGAILSLLVSTPSFVERFKQGGMIGYITIFLLIVGLGIVAERTIYLGRVQKGIQEQMSRDTASQDNPLGRIMLVATNHSGQDLETLELKLDEAILRELPPLERGIASVKILAGVGPLLGLLGTVTGMIVTFQTITLFGTGDPKLMAGGISQALVTTVQGLVTAIPLLLAYSFISARSQKLVQILEEQSVGILAQRSLRKS